MENKNLKKYSKFLSLVLRHKPEVIEIELDENGWCNVKELIIKMNNNNNGNLTFEILEEIVKTNNKKRFSFNEDKTKIRANQGHSINIDLELKAVKPPLILYHGTAKKNIDSIFKNGINKGTRQHVHLSSERETAKNVGQRHGKVCILEIDTKKMDEEGKEFFISKNGVWLTEFIDSKFIRII